MTRKNTSKKQNGSIEQQWPADAVERVAIDGLIPYARNARTHSDEQVAQIAASMREWGFTNPILVDEEGTIIAGHGRILAARKLDLKQVPVMTARGWSEAQKRAYVIADNKIALNAGWDPELLAVELDELRDLSFDMDLLGFAAAELNDLIGTDKTGFDGEDDDDTRGQLLAMANVTRADPTTQCLPGQCWKLGEHTLMVCGVIEGWPQWVKALHGDTTLFCPFPGPFVLASEKAKTHSLLLVQPDTYVAGHIVDRYIDLFGKDGVSVSQ